MAIDEETIATENYLLGIRCGLEQASGELLKAAGERFIKHENEAAKLLRRWSDEISVLAEAANKKHREHQEANKEPEASDAS